MLKDHPTGRTTETTKTQIMEKNKQMTPAQQTKIHKGTAPSTALTANAWVVAQGMKQREAQLKEEVSKEVLKHVAKQL